MEKITAALSGTEHIAHTLPDSTNVKKMEKFLAELDPDARAASERILVGVLEEMDYAPPDMRELGLEFFLVNRDDDLDDHPLSDVVAMSDDWRLVASKGLGGSVLYDFNGWPGDNELGGGAVVAAPGDHPALVFLNQDQDLRPVRPEYAKAVRKYGRVRHVLVGTGNFFEPRPVSGAFSTEQAVTRYQNGIRAMTKYVAENDGAVSVANALRIAQEALADAQEALADTQETPADTQETL
jgi:hypothetical protein